MFSIIVCVLIIIFDNMSEWLMEKLGISCNSRDDDNVDDEVDKQDCCPICLDVDTDNMDTTLCGHNFHHGCLADWEAHDLPSVSGKFGAKTLFPNKLGGALMQERG